MKKLILWVALSALIFSGCSQGDPVKNTDCVFTVNDETVSTEEFNIYLYETQQSFEQLGGSDIWETDFDGRTAESVAKDNTFNTIVMVKIAAQRAAKEDLNVDDETKEKLKTEATNMYNGYSDSVKNGIGADEKLYYDVLYQNMLYNMILEDTVKDYSVSDGEFESYFLTNKDKLTQYYKTNTNSSGPVDEDALKDYSYAYYENSMKQQYFSKEYDKWKAESTIDKNQDVWDKIKLIE
ncbi:hypothetical protein SDC9_149641 [bioreactor metagenome]|uniref:Peptidylprolyl isomerase n=1 Tax=bioreactor metagenome TaxID=1076179 RepID=A0A645EK64_9ZZZZ|nr:SurA N-terminal domain-containing protein [Candidatus Metalachnospira sp.]